MCFGDTIRHDLQIVSLPHPFIRSQHIPIYKPWYIIGLRLQPVRGEDWGGLNNLNKMVSDAGGPSPPPITHPCHFSWIALASLSPRLSLSVSPFLSYSVCPYLSVPFCYLFAPFLRHSSQYGALFRFVPMLTAYQQGRIQDLWKGGGGRSGYRERHRREGFWRVPFEDPLWNFKRGGRAPPAPPPPESASDQLFIT